MSKPWRVSKATDTGNYIVMEPIGGQVICEVEPGPEAQKNAYRIAAVGELLEAIKGLMEAYGVGNECDCGGDSSCAICAAIAAICKAEGKP